ncbi:anthranilate phosphoribosyltransferase [Isoptericola sp. b441]|uniref:Anthranilate phosphoribosyltransferase n=1 Tax=Actinotalea lenta TaxID=3064654 RepID=A0ABT9DAR6_9CELL|nr:MULTISPECIES: anthranilate phosphoribosyltransferase [unclassified Isoptericola]MDO8107956.1 anthranilate phosphoribosyltransferase [Isoptericola sp. b441]MDO8120377.1 anthranilate phosphoribosyltransferase [Isoptericola sp. b490]
MSTRLTWPALLRSLLAGEDLDAERVRWAMGQVMSGESTPVQLAGFLVALRAKGETVEELAGLADEMLAHAVRIEVPGPAVDVVGTGGDLKHTVNISTMAALVTAGAGVRVVKHGNRAATSSSGTADVLEELGLRLDHDPARVAELASEVGITFCFAAVFHPAMRFAGQARKELGVPTAFNVLGPLTNPAQPRAYAIGCPDRRLAPLMAGVLARRGVSALVFRGHEGLDELAANGPADLWWVREGRIEEQVVDPVAELGLDRLDLADLRGADPAFNAGVVRRVLAGEPGPVRQTVLLNAAAALTADGSLPGTGQGDLVARLRAGLGHAAASVDSGAAAGVLERWIAASRA